MIPEKLSLANLRASLLGYSMDELKKYREVTFQIFNMFVAIEKTGFDMNARQCEFHGVKATAAEIMQGMQEVCEAIVWEIARREQGEYNKNSN